MEDEFVDISETIGIKEDNETITIRYRGKQAIEAVAMLRSIYLTKYHKEPEFIIVDDVTYLMIKANVFNHNETFFSPDDVLDDILGMKIINKNNCISFTQNDITFIDNSDGGEEDAEIGS